MPQSDPHTSKGATPSRDSARTFFIETFGCQMNVLDSELVREQLIGRGFVPAERPEVARVVLINTCAVRELAEHKVWSRLGRLGMLKRTERPDLVIGVLGCMGEREGARIVERMPYVDLVCGAGRLARLADLLDEVLAGGGSRVVVAGYARQRGVAPDEERAEIEALDAVRLESTGSRRFQVFVRITVGCNKLCSFCVVPFTRGPEVHRDPDRIVAEVRRLVDRGAVEVTLLGQTVNHYRHTAGGKTTTFADLLWRVHEQVTQLPRLRFVTSFPRDFDEATLQVMRAAPRICRYLHLPAQSGSSRMLRAMNRGYTAEAYLDLLARIRDQLPDVCLAGDMIVGFPGETDADHRASMRLMERAQYKGCFVFKYSPRPGTRAAVKWPDDVSEATKKERNLELLSLQHEISLRHNQARRGAVLEVLVEGPSKLQVHASDAPKQFREEIGERAPAEGTARLVGRTAGDEIVAFDASPATIGTIIHVRAVDATPLTILAEPLDRP